MINPCEKPMWALVHVQNVSNVDGMHSILTQVCTTVWLVPTYSNKALVLMCGVTSLQIMPVL